MTTPILIRNYLAVGDDIVLTAFVRDLARAAPGRYRVTLNSPYPEVWKANPYIDRHISSSKVPQDKGKVYTLPYGGYIPKKPTDEHHFIWAYHQSFKKSTGVYVPLTEARPDIHFAGDEPPIKPLPRYWVMVAGTKQDFQVKQWSIAGYQTVVDFLNASGIPVVQIGKNGGAQNASHPKLKNVTSVVDRVSLRETMRIMAGADGVIGPVTGFMHMAAALEKPCVVLAGGGEDWWWEAYHPDNPALRSATVKPRVPHRYLHTIGLLDCCRHKGCWKMKVHEKSGRKLCQRKTTKDGQVLPQCMADITPERVYESVLSYYLDGTLEEIPGMSLPSIKSPVKFTHGGRTMLVQVGEAGSAKTTTPLVVDPKLLSSLKTQTAPVAPIKPEKVEEQEKAEPPKDLTKERLTICSVFYGGVSALHERWIRAIRNSHLSKQFDVRVFCNAVGDRTKDMLKAAVSDGTIRYVYDGGSANVGKYPAMRTLFHDQTRPIETEWVLWLDDDTFVDVKPAWYVGAMEFARHHPSAAAFGPVYSWSHISPSANTWIRQGKWFRGKPIDRSGIKFLSGGCWFIRRSAIVAADIPDARLRNNGGDVTIGEQLRQAGLSIVSWNQDKSVVAWSMTPRRGISEAGPYNLPR